MMISKELKRKSSLAWICLSKVPSSRKASQKCQRHAGVKFKLINISNRGTQVWPTGSVYTNLVNLFNVRFESLDGEGLNQQDILGYM
jgi:isocitrate dehydrogenase